MVRVLEKVGGKREEEGRGGRKREGGRECVNYEESKRSYGEGGKTGI